jgi:SagB-type dehydrogenase family enzyme
MTAEYQPDLQLAPAPASLITLQPEQNLSQTGQTLRKILRERQSCREFIQREISLATLAQLLWAACGINRPDSQHRTAPSTKNWQEIEVYVAMHSGLYLFDPHASVLRLVAEDDIRADTGWQDFVAKVPVNLIYVANLNKMDAAPIDEKKFYAALDTGFISQNVYLFCAAEGLATVVRGWVDRPALAKTMKLGPDQRIIVAQSVGYPQN